MLEYLNRNPGTGALIAVAIVAALLLIVVALVLSAQNRRARRDREKLLIQLRRENEGQAKSMERLNQAVGESMRQVAELGGALDARMEAMTRQNNEKLTEMRRMVGERLESRLSESFRLVNSQLADVHRGIGEMRELAANVTDLKKVLGNVKTRGVWGEVLLKNLLEELFAPEQYVANAAIPEGSQQRV